MMQKRSQISFKDFRVLFALMFKLTLTAVSSACLPELYNFSELICERPHKTIFFLDTL